MRLLRLFSPVVSITLIASTLTAAPSAPTAQPATPAVPAAAVPTTTPPPAITSPDGGQPAVPAAIPPATDVKAIAPIVPSSMSLALAEKLFLSMGLNWMKVSAPAGSWSSGGSGDVTVAYRLVSIPGLFRGFSALASFRFAPFDLAGTQDRNSYRGDVQGYHLGGIGRAQFTDKMSGQASAEVGMMVVNLKHVDNRETLADAEKSGVNMTVGAGGDWWFFPQLGVGPRLAMGFGRFSTVQFGVSTTARF